MRRIQAAPKDSRPRGRRARIRSPWTAAITAVGLSCLLSASQLAGQDGAPSPGERLQAHFNEGQKAIIENRYGDASQALEKALEFGPDIPELHASLGFSYFQQGRFAAAAPVLERAVELKPGMPNVALLLAAARSELGRFREAVPELERAFPSVTDPALKRLAGLQLQRSYSGLARDREAVEIALEMTALYPADAEVLYHAGRLIGHLAYVTAAQLSRAAPDSVWTRQAAGEAYESEGQYERAAAEYRKALEINPRQRGVRYRLGRALLRGSKELEALDAAIEQFELELEADPTNANAAYELGEIYRESGEMDKARSLFEQAVAAYPGFEQAQIALGGVLTSLGQPGLALAHLRTAIAINGRNEVSHYRLAQAHRALGETDEVRKALDTYQRLRSSQSPRTAAGVSHERVTAQQVPPGSSR